MTEEPKIRIAVDAMGAELGPSAVIGGVLRVKPTRPLALLLVGEEALIESELARAEWAEQIDITILDAPGVVDMQEDPVQALRRKDTSIAVGLRSIREGIADAFISAGNTGAVMATALLTLGRLRGVSRPAILTLMPTPGGPSVLLDVGANVDCTPADLWGFAVMGKVYAQRVLGRESPRVGLLSIGSEQSKGNELTRATYRLLDAAPIDFVGNVEGRDIVSGDVDVIVADGFVGNVVLKFGEGLAEMLVHTLREEVLSTSVPPDVTPVVKTIFDKVRKRIDYSEYGGAPLLGTSGVCIICHGGSSARAFTNAVIVAGESVAHDLNRHIVEEMQQLQGVK